MLKAFFWLAIGAIIAIWIVRKVSANPRYQKFKQVQTRLKQKGTQDKPY